MAAWNILNKEMKEDRKEQRKEGGVESASHKSTRLPGENYAQQN